MPPQDHPVAQLEAALAMLKMPQQASKSSRLHTDANDPEMLDAALQLLPKSGDLSTDDLRFPHMEEMKEKFDRETSLPPERITLVNRVELVETLQVTAEQTDKIRKLAASGDRRKGVVEIGVRRKFCFERLEKLPRISTSELWLRKTHEGQHLLCRTICPAVYDSLTGILLAVEDPRGDTVYVKLYNHPMLMDVTWSEVDPILIPIGAILAIREPMYVGGAFSGPCQIPFIKVDSPSDVVFVDVGHPILRDISWKTALNVPPGASQPPGTGEGWKARGTKEFKNSQWFPSAICFTKCIDAGYDVQITRLNRSEVYLRLGWNNSAFLDAKMAFDSGTLKDDLKKKAVIRMVKARYALGQYNAVLEIVRSQPEDELAAEWATKATKRLEEQRSGDFDWAKLFRQAKGANYSPDIGDYTGPVEVGFREGPIKLRGAFATRDVKVGELLMFEKAICSYWHKEDNSVDLDIHHVPSGRTCGGRAMYRHCTKVVQKVWDDKNAYTLIRALQGGSAPAQPKEFPPPLETSGPGLEHPTRPVVEIDIDNIFSTVCTNSFGCGTIFDGRKKEEETGIGLYALASLLNHSCVPSAHTYFIGDAIAVRANRDIKKGEEITTAYITVPSYDERRFRLMRSWRFHCTCELCEADKIDDDNARKKRFDLLSAMKDIFFKEVDETFGSGALGRLEAKAKNYCDDMKGTYSGARGDVVKPELAETIGYYAAVVQAQGKSSPNPSPFYKRAIELRMDSLDLEGFHVNDRSMSGPIAGGQEARLPVDIRTLSPNHEMCVVVVLQNVKMLEILGEKKRAQRWFDVALQMENLYKGGGKAAFKTSQGGNLASSICGNICDKFVQLENRF